MQSSKQSKIEAIYMNFTDDSRRHRCCLVTFERWSHNKECTICLRLFGLGIKLFEKTDGDLGMLKWNLKVL